jgi:tRNA A37 threonylcarbamoyltransferase TsaD
LSSEITQIIRAGKLEARPFCFFNFKGTPSQEEYETSFSGLKICKMALSNQIDKKQKQKREHSGLMKRAPERHLNQTKSAY